MLRLHVNCPSYSVFSYQSIELSVFYNHRSLLRKGLYNLRINRKLKNMKFVELQETSLSQHEVIVNRKLSLLKSL
jgi:hypothetical protein